MKFSPELSPSQHVARREALAQIERAHETLRNFEGIADTVTQRILMRYAGANRLDGPAFERTVNEVRTLLVGFGLTRIRERRVPPTRTRPKGEEHEFLVALRCVADEEDAPSGYEMGGLRFCLSRRRATLAYESNGIYLTRHALERSIERGLASWTGRLAEVEEAVFANMGLVAAWRRAFETGRITGPRIILPYGGGLILGLHQRSPNRRLSGSLSISGGCTGSPEHAPNPLVCHPEMDAAQVSVDTILRTVVDEDLLRIEQVDLRDALMRFNEGHAVAMSDIMASILWRSARIDPPPAQEALSAILDGMADELAALLCRPGAQEALNGRHGEAIIAREPELPHLLEAEAA